jgi:hypothetical protein
MKTLVLTGVTIACFVFPSCAQERRTTVEFDTGPNVNTIILDPRTNVVTFETDPVFAQNTGVASIAIRGSLKSPSLVRKIEKELHRANISIQR